MTIFYWSIRILALAVDGNKTKRSTRSVSCSPEISEGGGGDPG